MFPEGTLCTPAGLAPRKIHLWAWRASFCQQQCAGFKYCHCCQHLEKRAGSSWFFVRKCVGVSFHKIATMHSAGHRAPSKGFWFCEAVNQKQGAVQNSGLPQPCSDLTCVIWEHCWRQGCSCIWKAVLGSSTRMEAKPCSTSRCDGRESEMSASCCKDTWTKVRCTSAPGHWACRTSSPTARPSALHGGWNVFNLWNKAMCGFIQVFGSWFLSPRAGMWQEAAVGLVLPAEFGAPQWLVVPMSILIFLHGENSQAVISPLLSTLHSCWFVLRRVCVVYTHSMVAVRTHKDALLGSYVCP